jgi:DNA-binding response OmpR family regulator
MAKKEILLIEDSEPLRKVLAEKLIDAGFTVIEGKNGEEGLKIATEKKPVLILTDVVMFPMDGIEMSREIRKAGEWGRNVRIVVLTNSTGARDRMKTDDLDLSAYLVKAETSLDEVVKMVQFIMKDL